MSRGRILLVFAVLGMGLSRHVLDGAAPPAAAPTFGKDILPLLQAKCLRCHGDTLRRAGLDLRTLGDLLRGGESGPAVVPGKPDDSPLYEKIHANLMPPSAKDRLDPRDVSLIRRWIAAGAKSGTETQQASQAVSQHDVIPILLRRCTVCHGAHRQEGGLDVRSKASLLRGGKSGPAIVSGKASESLLLKRIRAGEMPPRSRLVEASVKPIEDSETDVLVRWIDAGAPEMDMQPDVATTRPDPLVSDRDRDFWAFRPPRPAAVPVVRDAAKMRNPIDAFLLHRLQAKGLSLAAPADRLTLLRRVSFDLTGLPPEPDDATTYLTDPSPDAYERLVDRLLSSPRYGERWARTWLDAAGYADSEGKREQDLPRPHAWRYRDYVIRAFDDDKPYTRFLLEQLAGDELADYQNAREITPALYDNLVATGFLRMAPDGTWANITGYVPDRLEVIADEIDVLGSAVMGLTMKCARCHSHKFDPLPQRDYYRLVDVFKGAYDEYDWLKPDVRAGLGPLSQDHMPGRLLPHVTTAERSAWQAHNAPIEKQITELEKRDKKGSEAQVKALRAKLVAEPRIQALWDRGQPSPTYLYRRGDPLTPGPLIGPGVPSVLTDGQTPFVVSTPWAGAKSTGRRLAFARWLTRDDHPLTARVIVNRIWKHHFGTGLVKTVGNFGKAGSPPSHPELLDWLATEFVRRGWRIKDLHRLLVTSAAYQQSSAITAEQERLDPENVLLSRMPMTRLDAEALYDTMLHISGRLDDTRHGPADAVQQRRDGLVTPVSTSRGWRRMIYVRQARKQLPTHLETFDYPQMNPNCLDRRDSTVAPQALHLMNNGMVRELASHLAGRIRREAGTDPAAQVQRLYWLALSRPPTDEERALGLAALAKLKGDALTAYCHTMLKTAAFVYLD